jgi:hypothetical protein
MRIYIGHINSVEVVASDLYEECQNLESEADISEEEWQDYNRVMLAYHQWQDRLDLMSMEGGKF